MMNQQSSQLPKGVGVKGKSSVQGLAGQFTEDPQLRLDSTKIIPKSRASNVTASRDLKPTNTLNLLQQANGQGGPAQPNDELLSAVEQIRQRHQSEMEREKELHASQQSQIDLVKDITEASNTTEFILLSLQRCFNLKPQQVQQLLQSQNMALLQACDQGLPIGNYNKITFWFEYLCQNQIFKKMISLFTEAFAQSSAVDVLLIFGALKCGLYSRNELTAKVCIQLLQKIADQFAAGGQLAEQQSHFFNWFTKIVNQPADSFLHNSVLQSTAECLEQHFNLAADVAKLYFTIYTSNTRELKQLPTDLKLAYIDDIFMLYETMNTLLNELNKLDRDATKVALEQSSLIQDALVEATENHQDFALKLKCTNMLIELWFLYPTIVSQQSKQYMGIGSLSMKDSIHFVIQQGTQERDKVFRVNVFANSFTLLDRLAAKENKETSAVYKTLIAGLLEHYKGKKSDNEIDQVSTEMILRGFKTVFKEHDDVPKHIMLDPFLDQLMVNLRTHKPGENLMTTCELEFLTDVIRNHGSTLPEDTSILMLEYFFAVYQSRPYLSHVMGLCQQMGTIVRENKEKSMGILRLTEQTIIPQCLSTFLGIKNEENKSALTTPLSQTKKGRSPAKGSKGYNFLLSKEKELASDRRLKRFNIVTLLEKLHEMLDGHKNQDNLVEQVKAASERYKNAFKSTSQGLKHLLDKWGVRTVSERSLVPAILSEDSESNGIVAIVNEINSDGQTKRTLTQKKKEIDWSKVKDPSNPIALRAVEQYQAAKQKRIEKQNKERVEEAKKQEKQERNISQARIEVAKRGLILERDTLLRQQKLKAIFSGNEANGPPDLSNLLEPTSILAKHVLPQRSSSVAVIPYSGNEAVIGSRPGQILTKKGFSLVDFDGTEEDREKDSLRLEMLKYTGLLRFLFDKYTLKDEIHTRMNPTSRVVVEKIIKLADLMKLYREHAMDHGMLTKHEFQMICKAINDKLLKSYGDEALNFAGYLQFFWQSAIYCHQQGRFKVPHETGGKTIKSLLLGEMVQNLVTWFKVAAKSRGHQTVLYDYPELAQDPQKAKQLAQLNEKLKSNPNLTLPPGFVLAKEMQQERDYSIPASARKVVGEKKSFALELLDGILDKSLGIRLFEPQIKMKETQVVRIAPQPNKQQSGEVSFRSGYSNSLANLQTQDQLQSDNYTTPIKGSLLVNKKSQMKSGLPASTLQSIIESQNFDHDNYGLGSILSSKESRFDNQQSRQQSSVLDIYRTENIIKIVKENQLAHERNQSVSLSRHRAANQLAPIGGSLKQRALSQVGAKLSNSQIKKRQISHVHRTNEQLLLQMDMSKDLKAATYELQLSKVDERDVEPIRQTAEVLETMLKVVTGELDKYPFNPKKYVKMPQKNPIESPTASSLIATKNKTILIKNRLPPGEIMSNNQKQKIEDKKKQEEQEKQEAQLRDMQRIKRALILKKKLAQSEAASDRGSVFGDEQLRSLNSIDVVDPTLTQLDKKQLQKLRAKQLELSQAEREAKKKKLAQEGQELMLKEKAEKLRAASEAKRALAQRLEQQTTQAQIDAEKRAKAEAEEAAAKQLAKNRAKKSASLTRLNQAKPPQPSLPSTEISAKVKAKVGAPVPRQKVKEINPQINDAQTKKERQEVLAFYLRPDVQTVIEEYDEELGKFYGKVVGATSTLDRDTKRMTQEGYQRGFGETAKLVPGVLLPRDLELIFNTIITERVDSGNGLTPYMDKSLAQLKSSLSFEEFKKSLVRIASLCNYTIKKVKMDKNEILNQMDKMLEVSGGQAPEEWDQYGNPIKYRTVIVLKKREDIGEKLPNSKGGKTQQASLYDIASLRLENFHKVLHFIVANIKNAEPIFKQKTLDFEAMSSSSNLEYDPFGQAQAEAIHIHQQEETLRQRNQFQDDYLLDQYAEKRIDMATSGSLKIVIIEARLTRDTDIFSKMDPYAILQTGLQTFKTRISQGAGKTPKWDQAFDLDVKNIGDDINVRVYDEDVTTNDLVGEATLKLSSFCINTGIDEWFPIAYMGKQSGTIHLKSTWRPKDSIINKGRRDVPTGLDDDELLQTQKNGTAAKEPLLMTLGRAQIHKAAPIDKNLQQLQHSQAYEIHQGQSSRRGAEGTSDGQFSEYDEVLKSPLMDSLKLTPELNPNAKIQSLNHRITENSKEDLFQDQYD